MCVGHIFIHLSSLTQAFMVPSSGADVLTSTLLDILFPCLQVRKKDDLEVELSGTVSLSSRYSRVHEKSFLAFTPWLRSDYIGISKSCLLNFFWDPLCIYNILYNLLYCLEINQSVTMTLGKRHDCVRSCATCGTVIMTVMPLQK